MKKWVEFNLTSFGTLKYYCVIKTRDMFSFLPLINNSVTIEFRFLLLIISAIISPKSIYILRSLSTSQTSNIGPQDVPRTSSSNVPRTSPKDPISSLRGRPDLTSWGRPEMTSRGLINLTSPSTQTWMSKVFFNFSFRNYSIDQI